MTPRPIVIDTDPGQDDGLAILLALASPELAILGITAVAGNVPLDLTESNARRICELAGRPDTKVFAGCARPMVRDLTTAEHVHGPTGLGGHDFPEPTMPLQPSHAVDWLVDTLMAAGEREVTLCTLGPLTNVAMAMVKEPRIRSRIREIVMMGGGFAEGGNVTPAAEFNIYVDPHAAQVVFNSGCALTLVPLDVTHKALTTPERLERFRAIGTPVGVACYNMLSFYRRHDMAKYGTAGGPLHDPCVIAYLLAPEIFGGKHVVVEIETASEKTLGMTLADWWGVNGRPPNCTVMHAIDDEAYFGLLFDRIARL
jgi:purine nucleosidase